MRFAALPPLEIAAASVGFAAALFAPSLLTDGDTYWHLAAGAWMLEHGTVPMSDPFSASFAGQPWHVHEWLAELLMAAAYRGGGWAGLLILFAASVGATLWIIARVLAREMPARAAVIVLVIAASCMAPGLLARPHLVALPVLAVWLSELLAARERGRAPFVLVPVMVVWANLHGSFLLGLLLVAGFALERVLRRRRGAAWCACVALCCAGACLTPWGPGGVGFAIGLLGMVQLDSIAEWRAPDFSVLQPIEVAILALLAVALTRGLLLSAFRTVLLLGVLHLALAHTRHQMIAGVVGALVLAAPLGRALAGSANLGSMRPERRGAVLVGVFALVGLRFLIPSGEADGPSRPVSALAHVPPELAGMPVLNDYDFGGYLIWKGIRPYVDGRTDLYGDAFLRDYDRMMRADPAMIAREAARLGVRWTMLRTGSPAAAALDGLPGWHRAYADAIAVVHVRD